MAWTDRLIDLFPDSAADLGAWTIVAGSLGLMAAAYLQDLPLTVGSFLLTLAGKLTPAVYDLKRRASAREGFHPSEEIGEEEARVDAFVLEEERRAQARRAASRHLADMASRQALPRHRLH